MTPFHPDEINFKIFGILWFLRRTPCFSYFCTAAFFCLNNKGKQPRRNKLKSGVTNNLRAKQAEKNWTVVWRGCTKRNGLSEGDQKWQSSHFRVRCPVLGLEISASPASRMIRPCKYFSATAWL